LALAHVRFGSKAGIPLCPRHVRFTPESGPVLRDPGSGLEIQKHRQLQELVMDRFFELNQ
jgi:hypothetical protein